MTEGSWVPKPWATFPTAWLYPLHTGTGRASSTQPNSLPYQSYGPSAHQAIHGLSKQSTRTRKHQLHAGMKWAMDKATGCKQPHLSCISCPTETWTLYMPHFPFANRKKWGFQLLHSMKFEKWFSLYKVMSNAECKTSIFSVSITKEKSVWGH